MASSGVGSSMNNDDKSPFDSAFWSWNRWRNDDVAVVDAKGGGTNDAPPPSPPAQGSGDAANTTRNDATAPFPCSSNPENIVRKTGSIKQTTSEPQTRKENGDETLKKMVDPTPARVGERSQQKEKAPDHHYPVPTNPELRSKSIHERPQKMRLAAADPKQKRPARVKKPELNVRVALTRQEIEEDLLVMNGMKPSRRPRKRPNKELQRLLDVLFPGAGLNGIRENKYKVNGSSSRKG